MCFWKGVEFPELIVPTKVIANCVSFNPFCRSTLTPCIVTFFEAQLKYLRHAIDAVHFNRTFHAVSIHMKAHFTARSYKLPYPIV